MEPPRGHARLSGARESQLFFGYITTNCFQRSILTSLLLHLPSSIIQQGYNEYFSKTSTSRGERFRSAQKNGNGQKRELPVDSWPETGGQKYEGSKHSIWAHVIGQHHLPPVSGRTPTGTSRFSLLWSAPTRFWPHFDAFCCSSPV